MRANFIAAWVTQQQRAFNQSTRGILTPENRQVLEDVAEASMAEVERSAAAKALTDAAAAIRHEQHAESIRQMLTDRAAALGLTAGQEGQNDEG